MIKFPKRLMLPVLIGALVLTSPIINAYVQVVVGDSAKYPGDHFSFSYSYRGATFKNEFAIEDINKNEIGPFTDEVVNPPLKLMSINRQEVLNAHLRFIFKGLVCSIPERLIIDANANPNPTQVDLSQYCHN